MTLLEAPWIPDADCETHEWRSAAGDVIRFVTRTEAQARMMPPVTIYSIKVPQTQGGSFRGARHDERLATIPVVAPGPQAGRDELRRWARALDPLKGEGTLTVVVGPWAGRQLVCVYEGGLDELAEEWPLLGLIVLGFRACDPYWQDATESNSIANINSTGYTWFPFAGSWAQQPLILGASDVFAQLSINNAGDVDAWPVITVTGPGTDLHLTTQTTSKDLLLTGNIAAGSTVVIDTRPGRKTVTVDGVNSFSRLTASSSLWPLVPGVNRVSIGFAAGTAQTSIKFAWRNRWLAA
jgi:hypothetical protein